MAKKITSATKLVIPCRISFANIFEPKSMENGEYLRSAEITEETNYNMIDGVRNNSSPKKKKRESVLAKLRRKEEEIARRSGKKVMQEVMGQDMERKKN